MRPLNLKKRTAGLLAIAIVCVVASLSSAIDNPDAPDYIGKFKSNEKYYQDKINDPRNTSRDYLTAYDDYLLFLDKELNKAYSLLMAKIPEVQREDLKDSQKKWITFRDAEFEFINNNWTRNNFGSSSVISRGAYRSSIVKNRIIQLLQYASNY